MALDRGELKKLLKEKGVKPLDELFSRADGGTGLDAKKRFTQNI